MARIRTIKPEFWSSLTIAALSIPARLQFVALWNYADDEGRGKDEPALIKAFAWPLDIDITAGDVATMQAEIAAAGLIDRYTIGGRRYFAIRSWGEHQSVDRRRPSILPGPDAPGVVHVDSTTVDRALDDESTSDRRALAGGMEGKGSYVITGVPQVSTSARATPATDVDNTATPIGEILDATVPVVDPLSRILGPKTLAVLTNDQAHLVRRLVEADPTFGRITPDEWAAARDDDDRSLTEVLTQLVESPPAGVRRPYAYIRHAMERVGSGAP